jgi:hypothetical protein
MLLPSIGVRRPLAMRIASVLGLGICLFCLSGCGGDSGEEGSGAPGGTVDTGVAPERTLGSLVGADLEQFCAGIERSLDEVAASTEFSEGVCKPAAMMAAVLQAPVDPPPTDAQLQQLCTEAYNTCLQSSSEDSTSETQCGPMPQDCTATVQEYETCMSDMFQAMNDSFAQMPGCEAMTTSTAQPTSTPASAPQTPPSCQLVLDKCPTIQFQQPGSAG